MKIATNSPVKLLSFAIVLGLTSQTLAAAKEPTLKDLLAKQIVTLDRPLTTFRYEPKEDPYPTLGDLREHVAVRTRKFYDFNHVGTDMAGPGLYVSVDPAATRGYGSQQPQLFVITLKQGTRVIDLREQFTGADQVAFEKIAKELKCFNGDSSYIMAVDLRNSASKPCRDATIQAFKDLGVQAIMYGYGASSTIKGCSRVRGIALNVITTNGLEVQNLNHYSDTSESESDASLKPFVRELYNEANSDPRLEDSNINYWMPRILTTTSAVDQDKYQAWKNENIWSCGRPRQGQESRYDYFTALRLKTEDADNYIGYELAAKKAFRSRFQNKFFMTERLRAVVKMQYKLAEMAKDDSKFDQWYKAYEMVATGALYQSHTLEERQKSLEMLSVLLEEPMTMTAAQYVTMEKSALKFFGTLQVDIYTASPGLYGQFAVKAKMGRRLRMLLMGGTFVAPLVLFDVPTNPRKNYSKEMTQNRRAVIEVLKKCTAEYNDMNKTPDEIMAGSCGVLDPQQVR